MGIQYGFNPFTNNLDMMSVEDLSNYEQLSISVTQNELYTHIANSTLIANQWYLVTDYRGYAKVPNTSPAVYYSGSIFISDTEPVGTTYPVTSATSNTVTDSTKSWTANAYVGYYVKITAGTGIGQERLILSNTADTVTTTSDWDITPDATSYYDIEMTEQILLRGATTNEFAPDGYSISYPDENIVFTQNITPIISTVQGTWEDETSYGTNTISDVTTYGFTIDDLGYHWSNRPDGYGWYIEAYDMYGSQYYDYGETYHSVYGYIDSAGADPNTNGIHITGAETFHVNTKGLKISDYFNDSSFYINISDGINTWNFTDADIGTLFTFDDNGDFVYLDGATTPMDLTGLYANGGAIEMGYNSTSTLTTITDAGLVTIANQGSVYIDQANIVNYCGGYGAVSQFVAYIEGSRPLSIRKAGTLAGTFYDPVNAETVTINDANEGTVWSYDEGAKELTLLSATLFDWNNIDFSDPTNFSIYWEFEAMDFTRSGSSMYIEWYYILREIQGMITKRINNTYNLEIPFDYRNRVIRRYECLAPDWAAGTYNAGAVVRYNGTVYACFRDGTTATPSDVQYWVSLFSDKYYYYMGSKNYTLYIRTTNLLNATATVPYDSSKFRDYRMIDIQYLYNITSKLNSKITCVDDDLDFFFPQDKITQFFNNKIHFLAGNASTAIGNWNDNDIQMAESLVISMYQVKGYLSNSIVNTISRSNFNYLNGCYIREMTRSNAYYMEYVFIAGTASANNLGYISQLTFYYNNFNYNVITYMFSVLFKNACLSNVFSGDYKNCSHETSCSQNIVIGTFDGNIFGGSFSQNVCVGQFTTTTCTGTFNGNWLRLGGNNIIKSLQTSTITSMSNNNCPGVDWSYMTYGTISDNAGTGQATVRYNKGETFHSNNFYSGENSMEIRNNIATEISSNTFRGRCNVGYNFVGFRISSCTFTSYCNVTYNQINGWLLSSSFGNGASSIYFSYNNIFAIETSNLAYNYQYNFNFDAMSSYTATKAVTSQMIMKNSAAMFSIGINNFELVHSPLQIYGRMATRYLSTNAANSLNKSLAMVGGYHATNSNQGLPAVYTCPGAEHTIINHGNGTGTTTATVATTNFPVVTMTIASPCVVTATANLLNTFTRVAFSTTGALPTGVVAGTYYWIKVINANTFNLYDTLVNAWAGGSTGKVNTSGSQSGVHSMQVIDTINGASSYVLRGVGESAIFVAPETGNDWKIKGNYRPTFFTSTRVPFSDANGYLVDDADMTFASDTLTVTKISTTQINAVFYDNEIVSYDDDMVFI